METQRPRLSLLRILEMNLGFLGLQFSFGLQQANMGPIWVILARRKPISRGSGLPGR